MGPRPSSYSSSPVDRYSKIAGGKKSWALLKLETKDHIFLILEVKETFLTTHVQKDSLKVKKGAGATP